MHKERDVELVPTEEVMTELRMTKRKVPLSIFNRHYRLGRVRTLRRKTKDTKLGF